MARSCAFRVPDLQSRPHGPRRLCYQAVSLQSLSFLTVLARSAGPRHTALILDPCGNARLLIRHTKALGRNALAHTSTLFSDTVTSYRSFSPTNPSTASKSLRHFFLVAPLRSMTLLSCRPNSAFC